MANMSYCRFENTSNDLQDCVYAMDDAIIIADMDLSKTEMRSMQRMRELCQEFLDHYERLVQADEFDGQPDEMQEWHDFDPDC